MKLMSIISEYNPFHNGHAHHLRISKELTKCTHTMSIMSGSFLQRGEPALMDKWLRARIAVLNGIDLVIELPFVYSCQTAEVFAHGAVKTLNSFNMSDQYLSFGCEHDDIELLQKIATLLVEEPDEYSHSLKYYLNKGLSYPKARELSVINCIHIPDNIMSESNNILAIEYLKQLYKSKSCIKPIAVKRRGAAYHDIETADKIAGATLIRDKVLSTGSCESISDLIPSETYKEMQKYEVSNSYNKLEKYYKLIISDLLRASPGDIKKVFDVSEGLENRILNSLPFQSIDELLKRVSTKRYAETRIKRILINNLMHHSKEMVSKVFNSHQFIPYIRVLAFNEKGKEIIRELKFNSELNIITNLSKKYTILDELQKYCVDKDVLSANYFFLMANPKNLCQDYYRKPEII